MPWCSLKSGQWYALARPVGLSDSVASAQLYYDFAYELLLQRGSNYHPGIVDMWRAVYCTAYQGCIQFRSDESQLYPCCGWYLHVQNRLARDGGFLVADRECSIWRYCWPDLQSAR